MVQWSAVPTCELPAIVEALRNAGNRELAAMLDIQLLVMNRKIRHISQRALMRRLGYSTIRSVRRLLDRYLDESAGWVNPKDRTSYSADIDRFFGKQQKLIAAATLGQHPGNTPATLNPRDSDVSDTESNTPATQRQRSGNAAATPHAGAISSTVPSTILPSTKEAPKNPPTPQGVDAVASGESQGMPAMPKRTRKPSKNDHPTKDRWFAFASTRGVKNPYAVINKWCRDYGDDLVLEHVARMLDRDKDVDRPVPYFLAAIKQLLSSVPGIEQGYVKTIHVDDMPKHKCHWFNEGKASEGCHKCRMATNGRAMAMGRLKVYPDVGMF